MPAPLISLASLASFVSVAGEVAAMAVAPPRCAACDGRVPLLAAFCAPCASTVEPASGGWPSAGAAFVYGGAIAGAIVRMKYEKRPDLARPLGHLLWRAIEPYAASLAAFGGAGHEARERAREKVIVIPVPLHPSRLADRGFNQASLVASHVAKGLGARFWPLALGRARDTLRQTELGRAARAANVAGAFFVRNPALVRGQRVVLVDDVRTTGATLTACATVLLSAGAMRVAHAVIAHAAP